MNDYTDATNRARQRWGDKLDLSEVEAVNWGIRSRFGKRVIVRRTYPSGEVWARAGRVGITTGWRPALLLVGRDSSSGSSDLLNADDELVATQFGDGRYYDRLGDRVRLADVGAQVTR